MLRTLKGFYMEKSAVDLDVNIVLSKYGFNCVAPLEIVMFGIRKEDFFASICLSKYAARRTFAALSKANVSITLRISNAIYRLAL